MAMCREYLFPASVEEALDFLKLHEGQARVIAGGTDLILDIKDRVREVKVLIDISRIEKLRQIEKDGDDIKIGAMVTHQQAASSTLLRKQAPVLVEASSTVGSPQVRNTGTIVGNVLNAQPAADAAVALFALDARIEVTSLGGKRVVPIADLYQGVGVSAVDSTSEIVTALYFKGLQDKQGSAFMRLAQRKALALPMLNVATVLTVKKGRFEDVKLVIAPVAPIPFRSIKAEEALKGAAVDLEVMKKAGELAAGESEPRDSELRGSAEYRREMVKVLVRRALEQAAQKAK